MAAIRLGDNMADDDIEKTLFLAFLSEDESNRNNDLLASPIWEEVTISMFYRFSLSLN